MSNQTKKRNTLSIEASPTGSLRFLYGTVPGRLILKLLTRPFISRLGGRYMNSRLSCRRIAPFVASAGIDMSQYQPADYRSYNDFFTRKIREGARPIDSYPACLIAPCDGKLSVYPITQDARFFIKGSVYALDKLLQNRELAAAYCGGTCLIFRLAVDDYHRYCYLDDGEKGENVIIPGVLHTVQPVALGRYNFYHRNAREYTVLHTAHFSDVVQIEVGALMVGKIRNHHGPHAFRRGEEKGMFEFGGSTIVLLLKKGAALIEGEILNNTEARLETIVKMGEPIGRTL